MTRLALVLFAVLTGVAPLAHASPSEAKKLVFEERQILVGTKTVTAEIADTEEKRSHGLMFRESLAKDHGMLFIFDGEQRLSFWMKNTLIPLAIGYFDGNKTLVDIQEMVPAVAGEMFPHSYLSRRPAMYALEMEKAWFSKNKIQEGAIFSFTKQK